MRKTSLITAAFGVLTATGCGANEGVLKSGRETPAPSSVQSPKPPIETDIDAMRAAGFTFIFVLRRKDGEILDDADKEVVRANTTTVNRRVLGDGMKCKVKTDGVEVEDYLCNKAAIIGTNNPIPPQSMMALSNHFAVENYSPPVTPAAANPSANAVK